MTSAAPAMTSMSVAVVIVVAAMILAIWIRVSLRDGLRLNGSLRRRRPRFIRCVSLDDLVQLSSVQPHTAAFGAIVDLDALSIRHRKIDAAMRAQETIIWEGTC